MSLCMVEEVIELPCEKFVLMLPCETLEPLQLLVDVQDTRRGLGKVSGEYRLKRAQGVTRGVDSGRVSGNGAACEPALLGALVDSGTTAMGLSLHGMSIT